MAPKNIAHIRCDKGNEFIAAVSDTPKLDKDRILSVTPEAENIPGTEELPRIKETPKAKEIALEKEAAMVKENLKEKGAANKKTTSQTEPAAAKVVHNSLIEKNEPMEDTETAEEFIQEMKTPQADIAEQAEDGSRTREIAGDITSDTNNEYLSCNLRVMGNIAPGILVTCNDLLVDGDVLGSLSVSGNVEVRGNIGSMTGSADQKTDSVHVTAKGRIQVSGNVSNAKVFAGKGLRVPKGDLVSSNISSCRDISEENGDVEQKIAAFEEKNKKKGVTDLPDSANARQFMGLVKGKIKEKEPTKQLEYIQEFRDSTAGMYNAAKKTREKLGKKYEALSKELGNDVKKEQKRIDQVKQTLDELQSKKDLLTAEQQQTLISPDPVIKVKNQVDPSTIIMGEKAKIVIDKAIYRVSFREAAQAPGKKAQIFTEGYFE